jgi:hypothetical protein
MFYFLIIKISYLLKDADEITDGLVSANLLAENIKILSDVEISESMCCRIASWLNVFLTMMGLLA